ncbi:expressed unknown protein [Seminavis robusta]|uniref:Uncharacterized protein n=1 Tax=Seminavis robusta TaxID=568900 RepID=A0A9N8DJ57_9STRA|nr:expressed unknown protein [Seminavis robusta]|eukprot:Sro150_g068740.1 n/a (271) ;mRNA; f:26509-27321
MTNQAPPPMPSDVNFDSSRGIIEDYATAKRKLIEAGFDPDDCVTAVNPPYSSRPQDVGEWHSITPMIYFCYHGDLPMCRYIFNHGGVITRDGEPFWFPMYAAVNRGNLAVVKWLFTNGAKADVLERAHRSHYSPWSICWIHPDREERLAIGRWFLANGAVALTASTLAIDLKAQVRSGMKDYRPYVLSWSQDVVKAHDSFQAFLMGTKIGKEELSCKQLMDPSGGCPVLLIGGVDGVLTSIADYVGAVHGFSAKEIGRIRRLVRCLKDHS